MSLIIGDPVITIVSQIFKVHNLLAFIKRRQLLCLIFILLIICSELTIIKSLFTKLLFFHCHLYAIIKFAEFIQYISTFKNLYRRPFQGTHNCLPV